MKGPLRVGVIGCGNVAVNFHAPAYAAMSDLYRLVAVADPSATRRQLMAETAGLRPEDTLADAEQLVRRPDIDVVDVCTPQHLRGGILRAAIAHGKHIICEKPLSMVPAEAAAVLSAAHQRDVVLGMVHNYLFLPEIVAARSIVADGALGRLRMAIVNFLGVVDSPGAAAYRPDWRHDIDAAGGGVLMDMLHAVYLAEDLLASRIRRVAAHASTDVPGSAVEDLALCRFEMAGGEVGLVNVGWGVGPGGIALVGARGRLDLRYRNGGTPPWAPFESMTLTDQAGTRALPVPDGEDLTPRIRSSMRDVLADFAVAVLDGGVPAATAEAGLRTLEATLAGYLAAATDRVVELPLAAEDPVHRVGIRGIASHRLSPLSSAVRSGIFDLQPDPAQGE